LLTFLKTNGKNRNMKLSFTLLSALSLSAALTATTPAPQSVAPVEPAPAPVAERFPKPDWKEEPSPYASPYAQVGGTLTYAGHNPPKSFNGYLDNNTFTMMVFGMMYPSLLGTDPITGDVAPGLADWWEISPDKLSFPSDHPNCKIDYIFVSRDVNVESADIPDVIASDHRPVVATLAI
jgi:ABC-type transport system substrate-binding protein